LWAFVHLRAIAISQSATKKAQSFTKKYKK
jgi:hypothetical protein